MDADLERSLEIERAIKRVMDRAPEGAQFRLESNTGHLAALRAVESAVSKLATMYHEAVRQRDEAERVIGRALDGRSRRQGLGSMPGNGFFPY